jgi:hypothetical protein
LIEAQDGLAMRKYIFTAQNLIWSGILIAACAVAVAIPHSARAQCASYSTFESLTKAQLSTLQVKISNAAPTRGISRSLLFSAIGSVADTAVFSPCELTGILDPAPRVSFVSTAELQAIVNNVATLPAVTGGGKAATPFMEFSLAITQPSQAVFAAILDYTTTAALFAQLRASLTSQPATLALSDVACSFSLFESGRPTDLTLNFTVTLSGVRLKRSSQTYVGNLSITNNSGSTPAAPLSVALALPINVEIVNPAGQTCATSPPGLGFINLTSIPAPGSSVTVPIEFNNPDLETLNILSDKVYAGPGAR